MPQELIIGRHTKAMAEIIDESVDQFFKGHSTFWDVEVPFRHGKALEVNTPIPTPSGFVAIKDLCVGDAVFNEEGEAVTVLAKTAVFKDRNVYEVKTQDGFSVLADEEHEWVVQIDGSPAQTKTTAELVACQANKCSIVVAAILSKVSHFCRPDRFIALEYKGRADTVCIQVTGPSHQYLCGTGFIPTHNSDIFSRALPGYFLGRCLSKDVDPDIILTGYGASLVQGFSLDARERVCDPKYRALFPNIELSGVRNSAEEWRIEGRSGKVVATGLGGSLTGKGYHLGICDDTVKSREEAESITYREKTYTAFTNDFLSRRAPTSITYLVQTPWHLDGVQGRLQEAYKQDSAFPRFKQIVFPARTKRVDGTWEYLFPERFGEKWYQEQYATLGVYGSAGPLDCNPIPAEGNICKPEWFPVVSAIPTAVGAVRAWDMAGTEKKMSDFTSGCLMIEGSDTNFYIVDYRRGQISGAKVPAFIRSTAETDGRTTEIIIEQEPAASGKIASSYILSLLAGWPAWTVTPTGDKLSRALPLMAQAEVGRVRLLAGEWNRAFLDEIRAFPSGPHDDMIDSAAHAFNHIAGGSRAGGF